MVEERGLLEVLAQVSARIVKGRIERTNLGDLCQALSGRRKWVWPVFMGLVRDPAWRDPRKI